MAVWDTAGGEGAANVVRGSKASRSQKTRGHLPSWQGNLLFFGLLILTVVGYFLWQIGQAQHSFIEHVNDHSRLVAAVVRLHARGSVLSQEVIEEILETFLGNTARFVDYLDSVEPFSTEELTAFAEEAGLAGIRIQREYAEPTEGPPGWRPDPSEDCGEERGLKHQPSAHLYLYQWPRKESPGCVAVGIAASGIEQLQQQIGLPRVLETLSGLPGIRYVSLEPQTERPSTETRPNVILRDAPAGRVAEVRQVLGDNVLLVGLEATHLTILLNRLWRDFFVFSALLAVLGAFLSWLLYRQQRAHLVEIQAYERELYRQKEDAALGRTAAAIAHEIRNPLNAIGIGLQRLEMEAQSLEPEHRKLMGFVLDAVRRADKIVSGLLNYARPQTLKRRPVRLDRLIESTLALFRQRLEELGIAVTVQRALSEAIYVDPDLMGQVVENLIKNAIEAQPDGGALHIEVRQQGSDALLKVRNRGFSLPPGEAERILEPYFTTKIRGTGLGLAICQRIVRAHGGHMEVRVPEEGTVEITVRLPMGE